MTFSAFMPTIKDVVYGTKYVLNGKNNENYKMFADAYDDSVTNSACINDITNFIVGEGLFSNFKNPSIYISDQDVRLITLDLKKQGQSAMQVIFSQGKPIKIIFVPIENTALSVNRDMDIDGYWYSYDWCNQYKFKPRFFQKFGTDNPDNETQMHIIRRATSEPLFAKPDWFPALKWAQNEGLMSQFSYRDIKNGFSGQKVINWSGGRGLTDEQRDALATKLRDKFSGVNGETTIVSVNQSPENSIVVDNISPPSVNATYVNYTEEAERKIPVAHSYPSILIAGAKTGFSSNADEIAVATKSLYRRVVRPYREILISGLLPIFKDIDKAFTLEFKDFEEEEIDTNTND